MGFCITLWMFTSLTLSICWRKNIRRWILRSLPMPLQQNWYMRRAKDPRRIKIHCEFDPHQRYFCRSGGMEYASVSNTETCGFSLRSSRPKAEIHRISWAPSSALRHSILFIQYKKLKKIYTTSLMTHAFMHAIVCNRRN